MSTSQEPLQQPSTAPAQDSVLGRWCQRLSPQRPIPAILAAAHMDQEHLRRVVEQIGAGPAGWAVEEAAITLEQVAATFAQAAAFPHHDVGVALETLLADLLAAAMGTAAAPTALASVPPMSRVAAHRGVPFAQVIDSMRETQRRFADRLTGAHPGDELPPGSARQLFDLTSRLFDAEITRFIETFIEERETAMAAELFRRRALVRRLIAGEPVEDDGIRALGLELQSSHRGLVFTHANRGSDQEMQALSRTLRALEPTISVLMLPVSTGTTWAWLSTPTATRQPTLQRLRAALSVHTGVRATIGDAVDGAAGFRRSHLQAHDLWELYEAIRGSGGTISEVAEEGGFLSAWSEQALPVLLGRDVERAKWFVGSILGPLAEPTPAAAEHRLTLGAFLDSGHSLVRAAELRVVHRNTIVYRIQRIERLLGRPIDNDDIALRCALMLASTLGTAVLHDPS